MFLRGVRMNYTALRYGGQFIRITINGAPKRMVWVNENYREKRLIRQQVMLTDSEIEQLKDWQFENRVPSMSAAIRELLRIGLSTSSDLDLKDNFLN